MNPASTAAARSASERTPARPERTYRVLMIAPTSFFADYGCHVRILEEARILQQLGHQATIVTYRNGGPAPGLDVRRTLPIPWRQQYEVGSSRHKLAFDALLAIKTAGLLMRERFDVIHAHLHEGAMLGLMSGRLTRLPLVFDFQGSMTGEMIDHGFLKSGSPLHRMLYRLERRIDRAAPVIFTSSAHARRLLVEEFGCDHERVRELPDAVNTEMFRPATSYPPDELARLRKTLAIPGGRRLIVYLGLLAEYQGTGLLLDALSRIIARRQDVHLLLMGFPNEAMYRQRAAALGIGDFVTMTGRVPYHEAPRLVALGDVAVSTKLSLTEGAGKLLNYMAAALPIVAFDTPVAREYLGGDGVYAAAGDAAALADRLCDCLFPTGDGQDVPRARGARLRARACQHYRWEKVGMRIVEAYDCLTGRVSASTPPSDRRTRPGAAHAE